MRKVTVVYDIYKFDELNEKAQEKAVNEEIQFELDTYDEDTSIPEIVKAVNKADQLQTPWFTPNYVWDYAGEYIKANCREREYHEDGTIYSEK